MSTIGNEFSGLPMADLIAAPLTAACDAQVRLARATADFINSVGFTPENDASGKPTNKLVPRQLDFSFWRPVPNINKQNEPDKDMVSHVEKVTLSVPLLALVNVPALAIKSIDITFDMEVKTSETAKESDDKSMNLDASMKLGWGPLSAEVKVGGSVSSHKENTRSTDKSAKYHFELHARDDGTPEGLSRVLDLMQSAIAPISISKPVEAGKANLGTLQAPVP